MQTYFQLALEKRDCSSGRIQDIVSILGLVRDSGHSVTTTETPAVIAEFSKFRVLSASTALLSKLQLQSLTERLT